ncbi:MAG: hypothetical protein ACYTFQ_01420, partial [Planctomycetota bacterium]
AVTNLVEAYHLDDAALRAQIQCFQGAVTYIDRPNGTGFPCHMTPLAVFLNYTCKSIKENQRSKCKMQNLGIRRRRMLSKTAREAAPKF